MDVRLSRLEEGLQLQTVVAKLKRRYEQKSRNLTKYQEECTHEIAVRIGSYPLGKYDWIEVHDDICVMCGKLIHDESKYIINIPKENEFQAKAYERVRDIQKICAKEIYKNPDISVEQLVEKIEKS